MKRLLAVVFALACSLTLARSAYAADTDSGTLFGIDDDLTVFGTAGTWYDPDVEVKGFTTFGDNPSAAAFVSGKGSVVIGQSLEVDADVFIPNMPQIAGVNSDSKIVVQGSDGVLRYETLKNVVSGGGAAGGISNLHLPIWKDSEGRYVNSQFIQQNFGTGSTLTTLDDAFQITETLKVLGNAQLGDGDDAVGVNMAPTSTALSVTGKASQKMAAEFFDYNGVRIAYMTKK